MQVFYRDLSQVKIYLLHIYYAMTGAHEVMNVDNLSWKLIVIRIHNGRTN